MIGIFSAAILFGILIVLLSINANLERAVTLLKTMQPVRNQSGLVESLAPVFSNHALDALEADQKSHDYYFTASEDVSI